MVDGYGGLHPADQSPALAATAYWQGWDIARGLAIFPTGSGGYVLDGWGGLHPVGDGPAIAAGAYWQGWDIARAIALAPWSDKDHPAGWVLDGWGGLHAFGGAPATQSGAYWPGWDIARGLVILPGQSTDPVRGYVLDGWGGLHEFGGAPPRGAAYWRGWDIARAVTLLPGSTDGSGYLLDGWGGLHAFGAAPPAPASAYWQGWDIARAILSWSAAPSGTPGGWVLDGWGGMHQYGSAAAVAVSGYWTNWDIARGAAGPGAGAGARRPDNRILNIPAYRQIHNLDCEAASLQMVLTNQGIGASQDALLAAIGDDPRAPVFDANGSLHWGDPYAAFVGDVNGSESAMTGYGVYYPPVAAAAQAAGGRVYRAGEGIAPSDIYSAVIGGHPAVAWVAVDWRFHPVGFYQAFDGRTVMFGSPYEHAVAVVGVNATSVLVNNPLSGPQWLSKATFEAAFATFDNMAVIVI